MTNDEWPMTTQSCPPIYFRTISYHTGQSCAETVPFAQRVADAFAPQLAGQLAVLVQQPVVAATPRG